MLLRSMSSAATRIALPTAPAWSGMRVPERLHVPHRLVALHPVDEGREQLLAVERREVAGLAHLERQAVASARRRIAGSARRRIPARRARPAWDRRRSRRRPAARRTRLQRDLKDPMGRAAAVVRPLRDSTDAHAALGLGESEEHVGHTTCSRRDGGAASSTVASKTLSLWLGRGRFPATDCVAQRDPVAGTARRHDDTSGEPGSPHRHSGDTSNRPASLVDRLKTECYVERDTVLMSGTLTEISDSAPARRIEAEWTAVQRTGAQDRRRNGPRPEDGDLMNSHGNSRAADPTPHRPARPRSEHGPEVDRGDVQVHTSRHRDRSRLLRCPPRNGLGILQGRAPPPRPHHPQHDHLRLPGLSPVDGLLPPGQEGRDDGRDVRADGRGSGGGARRRRRPDSAPRLRGHPAHARRRPRARLPGGPVAQPLGAVRHQAGRRRRPGRSSCR